MDERSNIVEHCFFLFTHLIKYNHPPLYHPSNHYITPSNHIMHSKISCLLVHLQLTQIQLLLLSGQLLLPRTHILHIPQNALPGLIVIALNLFHFGSDSLNNLGFPLPQFLHLHLVIHFQLLLKLPHL